MDTTVEFEKEVDDMTIFAANYIKKGLEQGLERGLVQGREQGVVQGGIQEAVESALEYGISEEKTLDKLVNKYHLSKEDAKKYYDKYATMETVSY